MTTHGRTYTEAVAATDKHGRPVVKHRRMVLMRDYRPGEALEATDRVYLVGTGGELRRIGPPKLLKRARREARRAVKAAPEPTS